MHIALIAPAPLPDGSGAHLYDRRIVAGLREAGHDADFIPVPAVADRAAARAAWDALPPDAIPLIDGLALPAFVGQLGELRARGAAALIHHPTPAAPETLPSEREELRRVEALLLGGLARVIATSDPVGERLAAEFAVAPAQLRVVHPGTEEAPRSEGSADGVCRILSIGMLIPRKGHDVLLRALARLFDLDWRLTIVGGGARDPVHANGLAGLADELNIAARVHFAGEADDAERARLWREADLFALASHWEGYGMEVAEGLRRGLPVAVTNGGAAAALVPAEAGIVCAPGDVEQLSKGMRRPIFDLPLRHAMAEAAWRAGQRLPSWKAQAQRLVEALA